jgi:Cu/Ag efflux protein CusF
MRLSPPVAAALSFTWLVAYISGSPAQPAPPASATTSAGIRATPTKRAKAVTKFSGVVAAIDASAIKIADATGHTLTIEIDSRTRFYRQRKSVGLEVLKPGDGVVAHVRSSRRPGSLTAAYVADPETERWLNSMRSGIAGGVVKQLDGSSLLAAVGGAEIRYELDARTHWAKGGKEAAQAAFKPGDAVAVVASVHANGIVAARIIADTPAGAREEKDRIARSVRGVITRVDPAAHGFTVRMRSGITRTILVAADTEIQKPAGAAAFASLAPGQKVAVSLQSGAARDLASEIDIE